MTFSERFSELRTDNGRKLLSISMSASPPYPTMKKASTPQTCALWCCWPGILM